MKRLFAACFAICALTACHGAAKPVVVPSAPPPPPPAPVAEPAPPPPSPLSMLRAEAEACAFGEIVGFEPDCAGYVAWTENKDLFKDGKANDALVEMLESKRAKVRFLAAKKLADTVPAEQIDAPAANAILNAASEEKSVRVAQQLGHAVARLPLGKLGLLDRAITVAQAAPAVEYTTTFAYEAGRANQDPKLMGLARHLVASSNPMSVVAAVSLFSALTAVSPDDACSGLDQLRASPSPAMASVAGDELVSSHHCAKLYPAVLTSLSKQTGASVADQIGEICTDPAVSAADRATAGGIVRKLAASTKATPDARVRALRAAVVCDEKTGRALAGKFKRDKNEMIAGEATRLAQK